MTDDQSAVRELRQRLEDRREQLRDGFFQEGAAQNRLINTKIDKRRELRGHFGKVYSVHWAGQGSDLLVSASQDGKLIVWNANTTNKLHAIPLKSCWVMTCAFEQEGNGLVASGGLDSICTVFKLEENDVTGQQTRAYKELEGHDGYISGCKFMGEHHIITSSGDSTCRYWDIENGVCLNYFKEHIGDVMGISPHPSNRHIFVSGSCDLECKLWDIRVRGAQANFRGNGARHQNQRQTHLNYALGRGDIEEVEGDPIGSLMTYSGHESDVNSVAFFPDGLAFGTGSDDASCRLFDMRSHQEINSFKHQRILCGITSVAFSSSARVLFGGYDDFSCVGWDTLSNPSLETQEANPLIVLKKHENRVSCIGVQSRGQALATGSWDTFIKVWA